MRKGRVTASRKMAWNDLGNDGFHQERKQPMWAPQRLQQPGLSLFHPLKLGQRTSSFSDGPAPALTWNVEMQCANMMSIFIDISLSVHVWASAYGRHYGPKHVPNIQHHNISRQVRVGLEDSQADVCTYCKWLWSVDAKKRCSPGIAWAFSLAQRVWRFWQQWILVWLRKGGTQTIPNKQLDTIGKWKNVPKTGGRRLLISGWFQP